MDYHKYFKALFSEFNLKDYQWQWVVSDSGQIVYDNNPNKVIYSQVNKIAKGLATGSVENIIHKATINGKKEELISSYYSTQLLRGDMGLVFSAPTDRFPEIYNQEFSFYRIWHFITDSTDYISFLEIP